MPRLITFGCSYTYGQGLPDIKLMPFTGYPISSSKLGWAALLSQKLKLELINVSYPGASNIEILYNILTFNFNPDDIVVIMWTHPVRDIVFDKWTNTVSRRTRLGFWRKKKYKLWEDQIDVKDFITKTWIYIHHADIVLKEKKLKYIHYPQNIKEYEDYTIKDLTINNLYTDGFFIIDKTEDYHPGLESNKLTADNIFRILNEK